MQCAKKMVSDCPGLVDFAIGLVNFVLNLPNGQVKFFEEFKLQKNCEINSAHQNVFGASWNDVWASIYYSTFSLPEWQALKMTFFAPWYKLSTKTYFMYFLSCGCHYKCPQHNLGKMKRLYMYVVVNFLSEVIFLFLLFLGMVMYANEAETKEKEKLPEIKN